MQNCPFNMFQCHLVRFKLFRSRCSLRARCTGRSFQCHLVRFKLFRYAEHGEPPHHDRVSMPSGSIQAIPQELWFLQIIGVIFVSMPSGSIQAIPPRTARMQRAATSKLFQCHLVRFKLFREDSFDGRQTLTEVSMPSGSIQAIPLVKSNPSLIAGLFSFNAIWFDSSYSAR